MNLIYPTLFKNKGKRQDARALKIITLRSKKKKNTVCRIFLTIPTLKWLQLEISVCETRNFAEYIDSSMAFKIRTGTFHWPELS